MKHTRLALSALALAMLAGTGTMVAQYGPPPQNYGQGYDRGPGDWDQAPPEFRDAQRRGFHDGIEGARHDFDNHRRPDVMNRDEFRRPPVPRADWHDYRMAFRRGYQIGVQHIYGDRSRWRFW